MKLIWINGSMLFVKFVDWKHKKMNSSVNVSTWILFFQKYSVFIFYWKNNVFIFIVVFPFESQESPPISPTSTISGPYIPISECISGPSLNDTSSLSSALGQGGEHYDAPRRLAPSPPRSPTTTDPESVFTDDEWTAPVPCVNWETFPSPGEWHNILRCI